MRVLLATFNQGKLRDYRQFAARYPEVTLVSLADVSITEDVAEPYGTFEENARHKAEHYARLSGLPTIADDSGIEIPFYGMEPGVHTKRWDGRRNHDEHYEAFILEKVKAIPEDRRAAQLRAVLAYADGPNTATAEGVIQGQLTDHRYDGGSTKGYPWDRLFVIPELGKYYEELTDDENFRYNHRRVAFDRLASTLGW